jgi:hypothetical protein
MIARGAGECGDGIFFALPDRMFIPCGSEAESVSSRYDNRDTPNYLGLFMDKVNPDLVVRDKQGRSYAACEFSEDRGYKAAAVCGVQAKWPFFRTATLLCRETLLDRLTH